MAEREKILYVAASPRGETSTSRGFGDEVVGQFEQNGWAIDRLDLWAEDLPDLNNDIVAAKYAKLAGRGLTGAQAAAWEAIERLVERVDVADRVVIATPMWNFGIPYKLKHWIDLITQPGLTFTFDIATGYHPLLASRPVLVILSSAGDYRSGSSRGRPDLATPYLHAALKFIGLADVEIVPIGPTVGPDADIAEGRERATASLAAWFDHG